MPKIFVNNDIKSAQFLLTILSSNPMAEFHRLMGLGVWVEYRKKNMYVSDRLGHKLEYRLLSGTVVSPRWCCARVLSSSGRALFVALVLFFTPRGRGLLRSSRRNQISVRCAAERGWKSSERFVLGRILFGFSDVYWRRSVLLSPQSSGIEFVDFTRRKREHSN